MNSNADFNTISNLDLDAIKVKLMQKTGGKGWTAAHADAVEKEYRRFLHLMRKFPNEVAAPLVDVDTFWHGHILDTRKYAVDCEQVFGYFLHHFPYLGLRGGGDDEQAHQRAGEKMREIYEQTFDEPYPSLQADAFCAAHPALAAEAAFCAAAPVAAFCAATPTAAFCAVAPGASALHSGSAGAAPCAVSPAASAFCAAEPPHANPLFSVRPQLTRAS